MPRRFTLRQIEYFVAVGELGGISLAAERLHVSAPSISTAISQLEEEIGLQLFIRHHAQGVTLTPEGGRFLAEAKALLAQADALYSVAGEISDQVRGALSVGALVTFAAMLLPPLRRSFEAEHCETALRLVTGDQADLFEALRTAKIDVALTYDLQIPNDVAFQPLVALPPLAMVPPSHPLGRAESVTLDQLVEQPLILLDLPLSREYFIGLFQIARLKPKIVDRVPDMAIIRSMVANDFGYTLSNARPAGDLAPDGGRIRTVKIAGDHRPLLLGLASARTRAKPRILRAFEAHCHDRISADHIPGFSM